MLPLIDLPFAWASNSLGTSKDELKLIFSFLLSYPLAGILKRLPDTQPWKKNCFLIGVSLFILVGLFDLWGGIRTLFISAAGAYAISAYVEGPYMPWVGFVYLMGHMLYSHMYRELYPNPGVVDVTGAQMVMVMKLTAFCWSVHDGRLPDEELSEFQKDRKISALPNLLDYAAYVLFFPSLFAGPAFDFREYQRWLDCSMFDVQVPDNKSGGTKRKRKIPKSHIPATKKAITGLFWIFVFMKLSGMYTMEFMLSNEMLNYSFLRRVWFIYAFSFSARTKYYGVWSLTEGACILAGLGYNGVDKNGVERWDRITNIDPIALETAQNTKAYLEAWNMNTNKWLKNYVYLRVTPKGKKPGFRSSMATFGTSALWHGISPGYYLTFVTASLVQTTAKHFRRHVRPFFITADNKSNGRYKSAYDIFGWLATQLGFSYVVAPFIFLSFSDSIKIWARLYFFAHIGLFAALGFFNSPGKKFLVDLQKKRVGRVEAEKEKTDRSAGVMGLPEDPMEDLEEIRLEFQQRRRESMVGRKKEL
ncbi:MBOAT, membrane-bound O-acyltransferase family-domain-containing protein [Pyronema omphalodes]|nr:MBOAT, membrane-bound O-acyltransferase family-domain-containing protein [Pyronema omphalodes]